MRIPAHTRIVVIPEDENPSREYGITRSMVVTLLALVAVAATVMILLMVSFAQKHNERQRIIELESRLAKSQTALGSAADLGRELEEMRLTQEQLLTMLGVTPAEDASPDTLAPGFETGLVSGSEVLRRAAAAVVNPGPQRWPTNGFVTQEFNAGNLGRGVKPHLGIDVAGPLDTPILAAADGKVFRVGEDEYLGNFVEIQHGLGYLTVYGHCSRIAVGKGDRVDGGQLIAYMGNSGQSAAVHLHFEIWRQGEAVDPRLVLVGDPAPN